MPKGIDMTLIDRNPADAEQYDRLPDVVAHRRAARLGVAARREERVGRASPSPARAA